jgi:hypothetical protein
MLKTVTSYRQLEKSMSDSLNSRITDINLIPADAMHLFEKYSDAFNYNVNTIISAEGDLVVSEAIDVYSDDPRRVETISVFDQMLISEMRTSKTFGLAASILLKEGIRYALTKGLNPDDGLNFGLIGYLKHIETDFNNEAKVLWFDFSASNKKMQAIGFETRLAFLKRTKQNRSVNDETWIPIERFNGSFSVKNARRVKRCQFPIRECQATNFETDLDMNYVSKVAFDISTSETTWALSKVLQFVTNLDCLYLYGKTLI